MKASSPAVPTTVVVHVPMKFVLHGGRKAIISDATIPPPQPRIDNALLKALAKAFRWRRLIESGSYSTITELAKAERVNESYACRLLRLTLLAPTTVEEILNGRQNSNLMLKQLLRPIPADWSAQMEILGRVEAEDNPGT